MGEGEAPLPAEIAEAIKQATAHAFSAERLERGQAEIATRLAALEVASARATEALQGLEQAVGLFKTRHELEAEQDRKAAERLEREAAAAKNQRALAEDIGAARWAAWKPTVAGLVSSAVTALAAYLLSRMP